MPLNMGPDRGYAPRTPTKEEIRSYRKALAQWKLRLRLARAFRKKIEADAKKLGLTISYGDEYDGTVDPIDGPPDSPFNGERLPWRSSIGSGMCL